MLNNRSIPKAAIIPEIPYPDVGSAVAWLCDRFQFVERLRIGNHRSQLTFGSGALVVTAGSDRPITQYTVMVRVSDVERLYGQVAQKGVRILNPLAVYPYGEMQFTAEDLAGHRWVFSQTIADVDPKEWGGEYFEAS
ncbi:MAG: hypothetical protein U0X20_23865 [Caldilineaceae bacterium]